MAVIRKILDKIVEWGERYEKYLERENAIYRAQVREAEYQRLLEDTDIEYRSLAHLLFDAIHNTEESTGLYLPKKVRDLYCRKRVEGYADGCWSFRFRAYRYKRESITANDVKEILQVELDEQCECSNYPTVAVRVRFEGENVVRIFLMRKDMYLRRRMDKVRETVLGHGQSDAQ